MSTSASTVNIIQNSETVSVFYDEYPSIKKYIEEQSVKGNFDAGFTPTIVEVKFFGLTYLRYENGKLTAARECSKGYVPPFWEICFDEEEAALFVLGASEVLLDRTHDMAKLDFLLEQCHFLDKLGSQVLTAQYS